MADGGMQGGGIVPDAGNTRLLRDALGRFATGVTVVTVMGPEGPVGLTANSFAGLSLDPPLVLWAPARASSRFTFYAAAQHFSVHVLGTAQADWPTRFARGGAGFSGLDWRVNGEGVPVLSGVLARFDCVRHAMHDGGDHVIIVGQIQRLLMEEGEPLVFAKGRYGSFSG